VHGTCIKIILMKHYVSEAGCASFIRQGKHLPWWTLRWSYSQSLGKVQKIGIWLFAPTWWQYVKETACNLLFLQDLWISDNKGSDPCVCVCVCVFVYNWVEQMCQLLWTCHVYFKVPQLLVLFLSRTSCFRSIHNVFYLKVSPLSTFTPVCYLSFGTLTYVTEQTHQILEISFCMNERKWDVSDETRLWWTFF